VGRIVPTCEVLCSLLSSAFQEVLFSPCLCVSVVGVLCDGFQHIRGRGVIAKSFAHVDEQIFIARRKHKAAAKLQRIFPQAMLLMSCGLGPFPCGQIVFTQKVKEGSLAQSNGLIGLAFFIDEKRELDAGFLAEKFGIAGIAQANRRKTGAFLLELGFKFAQLRDVLSAEDSTVMAEKDYYGRPGLPKRSKTRWLAIDIGECESCKLAAECFSHAGHSPGSCA